VDDGIRTNAQKAEAGRAERRQARRVRRLAVTAAAWFAGSWLITVLWAVEQWHAHGAFEHFGSHEGYPGDWNPTLLALGVGLSGLIVGIMALQVHFERPPSTMGARLKFHVAAWVLAMVVLTPLWALIEWQDNGGFERWSGGGKVGDWEPWILYVGGFWALGVVLLALVLRAEKAAARTHLGPRLKRLRLHH
jgi:hypothetical protein